MEERIKKTLYILDDPGRDRHFHNYALSGLENAGFSPLTVYFTGDTTLSTIGAAGHDVLSLNLSPFLYKNFNPLPVLKLIALIKDSGALLLHVQRHRALIYAGIACRIMHKPLLYTIRSTKLIRNSNRRFAFRLISPALNRIIAVSRGARADYLARTNYQPEKAVVVSNGIDIAPYRLSINMAAARKKFQMPEKAFIFGMAARFKKAKDHIGLIKAFAAVLHDIPDAWLALAGDGPREPMIRQTVKDYAVEKRVIFTGKLTPEEIPFFLKALDIFVHPSFREGMPAAVLEAMAAHLPVIATDAEGIPDIFDTPKNFGRMIKRGDIPTLQSAMLEFYRLPPTEREDMGKKAEERLKEKFTSQHTADGLVKIYNDVLTEI